MQIYMKMTFILNSLPVKKHLHWKADCFLEFESAPIRYSHQFLKLFMVPPVAVRINCLFFDHNLEQGTDLAVCACCILCSWIFALHGERKKPSNWGLWVQPQYSLTLTNAEEEENYLRTPENLVNAVFSPKTLLVSNLVIITASIDALHWQPCSGMRGHLMQKTGNELMCSKTSSIVSCVPLLLVFCQDAGIYTENLHVICFCPVIII